MPRKNRAHQEGVCYHVINRGNRRAKVFHSGSDYRQFIQMMREAQARLYMRILAYVLMPTHFHFVLWPRLSDDMSKWMHWLTTKHVTTYAVQHEVTGRTWQGRYKSFPINQDQHLLTVIRYVERNPLTAGLVDSAQEWKWSSLRERMEDSPSHLLTKSPVILPSRWPELVNRPLFPKEYEQFQRSVAKGAPFGDPKWVQRVASKMGLEHTLRNKGRPKKIR